MAVLDVLAGWFLQLYSSLSARLITSKLPRKLGLVKWQEVENQKVTYKTGTWEVAGAQVDNQRTWEVAGAEVENKQVT